jgi:Undecaprenyl-phosphate glucose phosphotransferase
MNFHIGYTLVSRSGTSRIARQRAVVTAASLSAGFLLADVSVIVVMALLTGVGYHLAAYGELGDTLSFASIGLAGASIFVLANLFRGEYSLSNIMGFRHHLRHCLQLWNVTFVCLLGLAFLAKAIETFSRAWILLFYVSTSLTLLFARYLLVRLTMRARRTGLIATKRIFIVGTGYHIGEIIRQYQPWELGASIVGCRFLTPAPNTASPQMRSDLLDRDIDATVESARSLEPDAILIVTSWSDTATIDRCIDRLMSLPVEIHVGPEPILHKFENVQLANLGRLFSLQLTRLPLTRLEIFTKRVFDLALSSLGILLLTPLMLLVGIVIKLNSPGPIFFLQRRYGFNQQPFRIIKFRTMRTLDDGAVVRQATVADPRVTRVGRWLRRWNIDELPQLFNVLKGDMSLIGPRPHALSHNHEYEQKIVLYARRHNVKPGITGWAQIHGLRGETDTDDKMRRRVEYDLHYIDNWSLGLDLQILIRTVVSPRSYSNAY